MKAAVTVNLPRDEVQRLWETPEHRPQHVQDAGATVSFRDAPGDRGTEIHADLGDAGLFHKLARTRKLAKVKDDLRHFKQRVETGEVPRSDATPEGESLEGKFKQRPAQPLEKAGVS